MANHCNEQLVDCSGWNQQGCLSFSGCHKGRVSEMGQGGPLHQSQKDQAPSSWRLFVATILQSLSAVSRCRPANKQHVKRICIFSWEAYEPSLKMAHIPFIYMPLAGTWSHTRGLGNLEWQNIKGENLKQLASYFLPPCPPFLAPHHPILGYHFFVLGYHFQSPCMDFKNVDWT